MPEWLARLRDWFPRPWLDHIRQDVRSAIRGLRRTPGFTTAVVVTLALGLGANAAMFGVIDRLMLRPPAYLRDPESVHRVYLAVSDRNQEQRRHAFEYPRYLDLARWTSSFEQIAAFLPAGLSVGSGVDSHEIETEAVSAGFWRFFAMRPVLGRFFGEAEDEAPNGAAVVVISSAYWKAQLGGRRDVIGMKLQVGALLYTIIGVAPDGFAGVTWGRSPAEMFIPIATLYATFGEGVDGFVVSIPDQYSKYIGNLGGVEMLVRRKPQVSQATATADLTNAFRRSYEVQRGFNPSLPPITAARPRAIAGPLQIDRCALSRTTPCEADAPPEGRIALWVGALTVIVLLIACANVANLLFARAASRRREIAMRLALGISRRRLAGQLLVESLLLASLACAVGLVVAQWASAILASLFLRESLSIVGDPRTIILAVVAAGVAGIITGLVPVLQVGREDLAATLKAGARDGPHRRSRLRSTLVVIQATLCVVLLVGAGLFVRSLRNGHGVRLGYDVDPVLYGFVHTRGKAPSPDEQAVLLRRLRDEALTVPGVVSASRAVTLPGGHYEVPLFVAGLDSVGRLGEFTLQANSEEYFRTVGTRVIRGRGITAADGKGAPHVVVVSEAMARRLWPGKDALGLCIRVGAITAPCAIVVGIAENTKQLGLTDEGLSYYLSIDQFDTTFATIFIRTNGDARRYVATIRRRLQPLITGTSFITMTPIREVVDVRLRQWQVGATMFIALGGLALVLAAVGLYSVIAYGVAQRTQELAVRVAVGARTANILSLVVGEGVRFAGLGIVVGCAIALAAGDWVAPLLFAEGPRDPVVFGTVGGVLITVAVVASLIPALRASRVDPAVALRSD